MQLQTNPSDTHRARACGLWMLLDPRWALLTADERQSIAWSCGSPAAIAARLRAQESIAWN